MGGSASATGSVGYPTTSEAYACTQLDNSSSYSMDTWIRRVETFHVPKGREESKRRQKEEMESIQSRSTTLSCYVDATSMASDICNFKGFCNRT
jgi:hypothetical protein